MKDQVMTKIWYILNLINQQRNEQLSCTKKWLCKAYFCPYFLLCTCSTWIFVVVLFVSLLTKCLKFQTWTIWIIWGGLLRKVYICYFWNVHTLNSEHGLMRYVWHCSKYLFKVKNGNATATPILKSLSWQAGVSNFRFNLVMLIFAIFCIFLLQSKSHQIIFIHSTNDFLGQPLFLFLSISCSMTSHISYDSEKSYRQRHFGSQVDWTA